MLKIHIIEKFSKNFFNNFQFLKAKHIKYYDNAFFVSQCPSKANFISSGVICTFSQCYKIFKETYKGSEAKSNKIHHCTGT